MANNHYDMTGVLRLEKVTPVIKALFGNLELDVNYSGNGEAYIVNYSEQNGLHWGAVLKNLKALAEILLQKNDLKFYDPREVLMLMYEHFECNNMDLLSLFASIDPGKNAETNELFALAMAFNDGHGLSSYKTEASWHRSKPELWEFCSSRLSMWNGSGFLSDMVEELDAALELDDKGQAAECFLNAVGNILNGIHDEATRSDLRSRLGALLSNPAQESSTPSVKPRVLVVVSGGIADPIYDDGVAVEVFDWDNYKDDPEGTGGASEGFADLAELCGVPVEGQSHG